MQNLKIIFFGSSDFVLSVLNFLDQDYQLVAVITSADSPIKQAAEAKNIFTLTPTKFDPETISKLKQLEPDLLVVASYGKIIPQDILDIPKLGAINIHPSLLPKYRGASPVPSAILDGVTTNGVTIIKMDSQVDHGPILAQKEMKIGNDYSTFETLVTSLFGHSLTLIPEAISNLQQGKFKEQNHSQATFTKLIKKEDGYFDLENPPDREKLDRMIRAYYPWPNAWTKWKGKVVKLYPGGLVQMEGKKAVKLKDFLNGYPDFPLKEL